MNRRIIVLLATWTVLAGVAPASFQFGSTFDYRQSFRPLTTQVRPEVPTTIATDGRYVFYGDEGSLFHVATVGADSGLTDLGSTMIHGVPLALAPLDGRVAVVTDAQRLLLVDVSDPDDPAETEGIEFADPAAGVAVDGEQLLAVVGDSLLVCDLDPLRVTAGLQLPSSCEYLAVDTANRRAYAANDWDLYVVDIAGAVPALLGSHSGPFEIRDVAVIDAGHLAVAGMGDGFWVADVTDPANPVVGGFCLTLTWSRRVAVRGTDVIVGDGRDMVRVDVSDPDNPVITDQFILDTDFRDMAIAGNYGFRAGGTDGDDNLVVLHIPPALVLPDTLQVGATNRDYHHVLYDGDFVYADSHDGFMVTKPRHDGFCDSLAYTGTPVAMVGSPPVMFVVTDDPRQVVAINTADPYHLQILDTLPLVHTPYGADLADGTLYVAGYDGLQRIDVTDPNHMVLRQPITAFGTVKAVFVTGDIALLNILGGSVVVYDLVHDAQLSTFSLANYYAVAMVQDGPDVLFCEEQDAIEAWNLSDPASPVQVGTWSTAPAQVFFEGMALRDGVAYLAGDRDGYWVVDVSDHTAMTTIGRAFNEEPGVNGLTVGGYPGEETLCLATADSDLVFAPLDAADPLTGVAVPSRRPALAPNAPNPFNPRTEIRFTLPAAARVMLGIYDLQGRRVRVLRDGMLPAGEQRVIWNGRTDDGTPAASGVYLARLESEGGVALSRKITLAR